MNILLIDRAPFFGGTESFLLDLLSALNRGGFVAILVTDPRSPALERFRASDARVLTTPLPHVNRSPIFPWRLSRAGTQLARIAASRAPNNSRGHARRVKHLTYTDD